MFQRDNEAILKPEDLQQKKSLIKSCRYSMRDFEKIDGGKTTFPVAKSINNDYYYFIISPRILFVIRWFFIFYFLFMA